MAIKMPTQRTFKPTDRAGIGNWFKNASRSLGYTIKEQTSQLTPNISGTLMSTWDSAKEGADLVKTFAHAKGAKGKANVILHGKADDYLSKAIKLFQNGWEDLKTGNLNNQSRGGDLFGDFSFDDDDSGFGVDMDFGDLDAGDIEDSGADVITPNIHIDANITADNPMVQSINMQTELTKSIAEAEAERDYTIANAQMILTKGIGSNVSGNLGVINESLGQMINFNKDVMGQYVSASTQYYSTTVDIFGEMLTEIKKISSPEPKEQRKRQRFDIGDIFGYGSGLNMSGYIDQIKKNVKNHPVVEMLTSAMDMTSGTGILDSIVDNPIGMLTGALVGWLTPERLKQSMERLDKTVNSFMPAMLKKISGWSNDYGNDLKQLIGQLFGVDTGSVGSIRLDQYERGAVPFDGVTRRSIVEVIPTYLSKIHALLEASPALGLGPDFDYKNAMVHDWETGTYTTYGSLAKKHRENELSSVVGAYDSDFVYAVRDRIDDYVKTAIIDAADISDDDRKANEKKRAALSEELRDKFNVALYKMTEAEGLVDLTTLEGLGKIFTSKTSTKSPNIRANTLDDNQQKLFLSIMQAIRATPEGRRILMDAQGMGAFDAMARRQRYVDDMNGAEMRDLAGILHGGAFTKGMSSAETATVRGLTAEEAMLADEYKEWLRREVNACKADPTRVPSDVPEKYRKVSSSHMDTDGKRFNEQFDEITRKRKPKGISGKISTKIGSLRDSVAKIINSPLDFFDKFVDNTTKVLYQVLFGKDDEDEDGEKGSLGKRILNGIKGLGNKINDGLFGEKGFFSKIENSEWYKSLTEKGGKFRDWLSNFISGPDGLFRGMLDSFSSMWTKTKSAVGSSLKDSWTGIKNFGKDVFGVTKKGEKPDPNTPVGATMSFTDKLRGGFQSVLDTFFGRKQKGDGTVESNVKADDVLTKLKEGAPDAAAKGIIGGIAGAFLSSTTTGLLSGLVLGPVGGAAVGFASSFLMKSDKFKEFLFGKDDYENNRHIEGLISKNTQEFFKKNKSAVIGGGLIGGAAGGLLGIGILPSFILGGPISGALLGMALGIGAKSESFQKFMFGDIEAGGTNEGALSRLKGFFGTKTNDETIGSIKKVGIGAGIGSIGFIGLLGMNPILGAFAGLAGSILANSKAFKEFFFGSDEDADKPKPGLLNKFKDGIVDNVLNPIKYGAQSAAIKLVDWFDNDILKYVEDGFDALIEGGKFAGESLKRWFKNTSLYEFTVDKIITPIKDMAHGILDFTKDMIGTVGKFIFGTIKRIVSTPVKLVSKIVTTAVNNMLESSIVKTIRQQAWNNILNSPVGKFITSAADAIGEKFDEFTEKFNKVMKNNLRIMGGIFKGVLSVPKAMWNANKGFWSTIWNSESLEEFRARGKARANQKLIAMRDDYRNGTRSGWQSVGDMIAFSPLGRLNPFGVRNNADMDILGNPDDPTDPFFASTLLGNINRRKAKRDAARAERNRKRQEKQDAINKAKESSKGLTVEGTLFDKDNKLTDKEKKEAKSSIMKTKYPGYDKMEPADRAGIDQREVIMKHLSDTNTKLDEIKTAITSAGNGSVQANSGTEIPKPKLEMDTIDVPDSSELPTVSEMAYKQKPQMESVDTPTPNYEIKSSGDSMDSIEIPDANSRLNSINNTNKKIDEATPGMLDVNLDASDAIGIATGDPIALSNTALKNKDNLLGMNSAPAGLASILEGEAPGNPLVKILSSAVKNGVGELFGTVNEATGGLLSPLIDNAKMMGTMLKGTVKLVGNIGIGLIAYRLLAFLFGWENKVTEFTDKLVAGVVDVVADKLIPTLQNITIDIIDAITKKNSGADEAKKSEDAVAGFEGYSTRMNNLKDEEAKATFASSMAEQNKAGLDAMIANDEYIKGRDWWSNFKATGNVVNTDNTTANQAKRLQEMKTAAQIMLDDADAGYITLSDDERTKYESIVNTPDIKTDFWSDLWTGMKSTASSLLTGPSLYIRSRNEKVADSTTDMSDGYFDARNESEEAVRALKTGKAIGDPNITNNMIAKLHKGEGVLTASANHMFGDSATTAEVLNEYARRGMNRSEGTTDPISVMQGTTGNLDGIKNALYGNTVDTSGMEAYIATVRDESLTVDDANYWKFDKTKAGNLGGIAEAMFKITRFVNYPIRLINNTMGGMSSTLKDTEKEVTAVTKEIEETTGTSDTSTTSSGGGIFSKIKNAFTGAVSKVKDLFTGGPSGEVKDTTSNSNVGIGYMGWDKYYRFPSTSSGDGTNTDFNPSRNGKPHKGIDLTVTKALDGKRYIRALTGGVVEKVSLGYSGGYGNMVRIRDNNGKLHLYAHMDDGSVSVAEGDTVNRGDIIGVMGNTGASRGAHLHYEVGDPNPGKLSLTNNIHPAAYTDAYNSGSGSISIMPLNDYKVLSYWKGTATGSSSIANAGPTTYSTSTSGGSASSSTNPMDIFLAPFNTFNSAISDAFNTSLLGKSSSSTSAAAANAQFSNYGSTTNTAGTYTDKGYINSVNGEKVWKYFRGLGYSKEATAAIIGNLIQESTINIDPTIHEKGGSRVGRGIKQWTESLGWNQNVIPITTKMGLTDPFTLEPQLETMRQELEGIAPMDKYSWALMNRHFGGLDNFKSTTDLDWATKVFERTHERSGDVSGEGYSATSFTQDESSLTEGMRNRLNNARAVFDLYGNAYGGPDGEVLDTSSRGTVSKMSTEAIEILISKAIELLARIAGNTKATAVNTANATKQQQDTRPQSGSTDDSDAQDEMYKIANRRHHADVLKGKYDVAKTIARGGY